MELKKFFIVEARHPNVGTTIELKVFSTKKEALRCARHLARVSFFMIDVFTKEGTIARANYDDLRTDGVVFKEKDC
jgi:hypothetical protein